MTVTRSGFRVALAVVAIGSCVVAAGGVMFGALLWGNLPKHLVPLMLILVFGGAFISGCAGWFIGTYIRDSKS